MDNSSIHRKNVIRELVEPGGHQLLFLPKYSPDLNEIEHDFSALKRAKMYSPINSLLMKLFVIIIPNSVSFLFTKTISSILHLGKRFKFCICKWWLIHTLSDNIFSNSKKKQLAKIFFTFFSPGKPSILTVFPDNFSVWLQVKSGRFLYFSTPLVSSTCVITF